MDFSEDTLWDQLAKVKDIQPGELTVEDDEDEYLDNPATKYKDSSPGDLDAGETSVTLAWLPGSTEQQQLLIDAEAGTKTWYRAKYANGAVDCWFGYINSLGRTIAVKERMQRTIKIKNCAAPKYAEEILGA